MLDLRLAFRLVDRVAGARSTGVVCAIVIGVNARVPRQLVGARETFLAAGERALKRFLARVGTDVTSLGQR